MRLILRFLLSRTLWTFITLVLISAIIVMFGDLLEINGFRPLYQPLVRWLLVAAIFLIWLFRVLVRQLRAARANQSFVAELAKPEKPLAPGAENVAEVNEKFQDILSQMKRSKLGGRRFLREMPWYVIIGPPGTGKTTALRQSGLNFPIDLSDDLKGVGGTRNCDWFFTEDAILIDTAGRYVQQLSDPETDAAEWTGFLDLLRKHRGRRSLNGVILTLSVQELLGDPTALREHGRECRRRLLELYDRLEIKLPVYLMITKTDLLPGFESFFGALNTRGREQVWGATLPVEARVDPLMIEREMRALQSRLEDRLPERIAADVSVPERGEIFRFPAELDGLTASLKTLNDIVFGESNYEETPWLRGFYLTSATQEGTPIDRMVGAMAQTFGLRTPQTTPRRHSAARSFFLRDLLTDVIFEEAGLGTFDPKAEERRRWTWRGALAAGTLASLIAAVFFIFSFQRYNGAIDLQDQQFQSLSGTLREVTRTATVQRDPLDLHAALDAIGEVERAQIEARTGPMTSLGPSAAAELASANETAYQTALRDILEPRMVALLEVAMWRNIEDPVYTFDALKAYQMMTGLTPMDADFTRAWWETVLPVPRYDVPIAVFPTEDSLRYQLDAIDRIATQTTRPGGNIGPTSDGYDQALVTRAYQTICAEDLTLASLAFNAMMAQPAVNNLNPWSPASAVRTSIGQVFERRSDESLRRGLPGAFTYDGFRATILPMVDDLSVQFQADGNLFGAGCPDYANITEDELKDGILELYFDAFIAQWDLLLSDIRLTAITDLRTAQNNLQDLASGDDSALFQLLAAIVRETHLTRSATEEDENEVNEEVGRSIWALARRQLGAAGRQAGRVTALATGSDSGAEPPGGRVARYYAPLRGMIESVNDEEPRILELDAALTTLSDQIIDIFNEADPEQELLVRGGMPALIGDLTRVGRGMPNPVDDWILALSDSAVATTRDAIIAQLDENWRSQYLAECRAATDGFPFTSSGNEVTLGDFQRVFGPGGDFDTFMEDSLDQYIDRSRNPWAWRQDFGLDPEALAPFEQARAIQRALFPQGSGPYFSFTLDPYDLQGGAQTVVLNVDGTRVSYSNADVSAERIEWPGPDRSEQVTLSFTPFAGGSDVIVTENGPWALLRIIDSGRLVQNGSQTVYRLFLFAGGYTATYDLRADSRTHPLDLALFSGFRCPEGFP